MPTPSPIRPTPALAVARGLAVVALVALLNGCGGGGGAAGGGGGGSGGGGGGGAGGAPTAIVTSATVSAPRYAAATLLTLVGSSLTNVSISADGCQGLQRLTEAPTASSDTTAYYACTVSGPPASTFSVASNGQVVATVPLAVAPPQVTFTLSNGSGLAGSVVLDLDPGQAPITVDNFLSYVNAHFYDGLVFHDIVPGSLVQGGGYGPLVQGAVPPPATTAAAIPLETGGGPDLAWTVAMARGADPDSATSQFFVNLVDNSATFGPPAAYAAVFGTVSAGTSLLQQVGSSACLDKTPVSACWPTPDVVITTAIQTR